MNNSLAEVHPELVSEWSEKNLPLTPDDITFGSNKKVWWKGACGHEWEKSVKARSNGEKCPICSGARAIAGINDLATLEPLLVKQWSKKNKIKPTEVSIGSHKKVIWRCEKGHEWEAAVKSRTINKTGCPYCSHNKVLAGFNDFATLLPGIAAEWSDRNYPLLPTQVTVFANRKAWWKCNDCRREWNTLISTRSGGSKCPYCSGYIFLKGFNDLQTTHPEIASEWSEKNLPLKHSITKAVLAPMKAVKKMLISMELHLDASIDKLDNLAMNVQLDKEKHMENAKAQEQIETERAEAERVEAEVVYSPMVAEPQEYQYNADAFEARGVDEVKQEAAHKEVSKVREDKAR